MGHSASSHAIRAPRRTAQWRTLSLAAAYAISASLAAVSPASAQSLPLIRDTEIENLLKDYSRPIFRAAGLGAQNVAIRIIRHDSFNAFVLDGHNVFIHSGALLQAKTPNEVIGVIAHETGHIVGGHMAALRARIARDQTKALLITLLGIGMMVGGAVAGTDTSREMAGAGSGVLLGGNDMVMRSLLAERRSQESSADQAGIRFLDATHQSGRGMLETFERFAQQEYISATYQDPFVRSHPVASDRIAQLRERATKSPYFEVRDPPQLQLRHDMMRAKLAGYLEPTQAVFNRYPASDNSLPARYARAIARNCSGKCADAMGDVDQLLREKPDNAYFWELKGLLLFWVGKHQEAIPPLRKSLKLAGDESLIQAELAEALLATEDHAVLEEAIALLRRASALDDDNSMTHHQLAKAFYMKGQYPQADLEAAQAHFVEGNVKQAQIFAKRALAKLPRGSPEWIRAEDIVNYKEQT